MTTASGVAERICEVCGSANDPAARFCRVCDNYLGWDSPAATLDGQPLVGDVPAVVAAVEPRPAAEHAAVASEPAAPAPEPAPPPAAEPAAGASTARIEPPVVALDLDEVLVTPDAPATVPVRLTNPSSIVDGYVIAPVDPPAWLAFAQGDAHLLPGQETPVAVTISVRDDVFVPAQRLSLTIRARSEADAGRFAEFVVPVTVPPLGPRAGLEVRPSLIRLDDHAAGEFTIRLDNRAANFPQTVQLSASDTEDVVRVAIAPSIVTVPPGQAVEVVASFTAPEPEPGREVTRQLSVESRNDAGRAAVALTIVQRTAAAPVDAPITARVEPSSLRVAHGNLAEFDVLIDHRGGHTPVSVSLSGLDPARVIGFAFSSDRLVLDPGQVERVRGRLSAPLPPRGETATHPFTIVVSDGVQDVEAGGTVELTSPPEPILLAGLRVDPPTQLLVNERQAAFQVQIDNRRSAEPLVVRLDGSSDDGAARLSFAPPEVMVPPGTIGASRMTVDAPRPDAGESATRRLRILATDGARTIEAQAAFTQASADRRPIASRVLVILGGVLVIVGALVDWFAGFPAFLPSIDLIAIVVRSGVDVGDIGLTEPATRVLVLLLAALMLLGMVGSSGRLTRASAILVVLLTVGWLVFLAVVAFLPPLGLGLFLVWAGAVLGFIGGVLAKPRRD